jgi:aspartate aminotransferase
MFENLPTLPADPILGLMEAFRADSRDNKIDLGVGVYRNEDGDTPILAAVKKAEAQFHKLEETKSYIAPPGTEGFNRVMQKLLFGDGHPLLSEGRISSVQTPGGCGALSVGANLLVRARPNTTIWVSDPTWANHIPLLGNAGLQIQQYPYYDEDEQGVAFDRMLGVLEAVPVDDVVLLHGCCHNPSGADLNREQWNKVAEVACERGWLPFVDIAYQGLGDGVEEDAAGVRILADSVPEMMVAASCSKNFGLYRERTGLLAVVGSDTGRAEACLSQMVNVARGIYSMPPSHGAGLVELILHSEELKDLWISELDEMRNRINQLRSRFSDKMAELTGNNHFDFIRRQRGMFSFLGVTPEQVARLREEHAVYMIDSSRINIAGMSSSNMDRLCQSVAAVL